MLIFDAHCDALSCALTEGHSLNEACSGRQFDFASAVGVSTIQVMAVFVDKEPREQITYEDFLVLRERLEVAVTDNARVELVTERSQLFDRSEENLGVILAVEGGEVLGDDVGRLDALYDLGVRTLTLTWNNDNLLASGGCSGQTDHGLTRLGRQALKRMNALGMVVDVAHLAPQGVRDVLRMTEAPVIASHANCAALCTHPRNLTDDQIRALAGLGGVVGITYVSEFLQADYRQASVADVLDHLAHLAYLVGVEHVGLGSDFDGITHPLPGLAQISDVPLLVEKLRDKGFHHAEIAQIMGGNFVRVFADCLH